MEYIITKRNLRDFIIKNAGNQIFTVQFVKRTNGDIRNMVCRLGVRKGVKGVELDRWDKDKRLNLLTVFDMKKDNFRRINIDGVRKLKLNNNLYIVKTRGVRIRKKDNLSIFEYTELVLDSFERNIQIYVKNRARDLANGIIDLFEREIEEFVIDFIYGRGTLPIETAEILAIMLYNVLSESFDGDFIDDEVNEKYDKMVKTNNEYRKSDDFDESMVREELNDYRREVKKYLENSILTVTKNYLDIISEIFIGVFSEMGVIHTYYMKNVTYNDTAKRLIYRMFTGVI